MSSLTAAQRSWDRITDASPMHLLTKPQAGRLVRASIVRFDAEQARVPAGFEGGGRFRSLADRLTALLQDWVKGEGPDDPLDEFNREQLRKTAKGLADKATAAGDHDRAARLTPRRGASSDEIKLALYKDMRSRRDAPAGKPEGPKVTPRKADAPTVPKSDLPDNPEALRDALDLRKVPELKDMLREQGLPVSGRKRELVDRLVAHQVTGGRAPAKATDFGSEEKIRADVAEQVAYFARLIRDGQDPHDRETTPKLDRIAAGLTDGSLSDADASAQLAALADEYAGSASGDNLRNWSRALAPDIGPEQKARIRQAEIDKARGIAEVAAEVHELIGNETDPDAIRRSLRAIGQRHGVDTAHLQDLADDPVKLREAADEMAKTAKLTRIGSAGEPVSFDRKRHEGIAGPLRDGQSVEVVRPGYSARLADGEQVQISKAKVEAAPAKAVKKAAPSKRTPAKTASPVPSTPAGAAYQLPPGVTQSDYQALVTASRRRRDITGMPGADNPALAERASIEANSERILGQFQEYNPRQLGRMTTTQAQADLTRRAREAFADRAVATNLDERYLREVLRDGRFKTQFETGRSGGVFQPEERAFRESVWFGLPADTPPELRPIYGYLVTGGSGKKLVDTYGGAQVILRPEVRTRTTAMVGDSMEHILAGRPAPVDDPDWHAFTPNPDRMDAVGKVERNYDGPAFNRDAYIEAQVHGGVTVDDIAEVVFAVRPDEETRRLLEEAGIKWRVKR